MLIIKEGSNVFFYNKVANNSHPMYFRKKYEKCNTYCKIILNKITLREGTFVTIEQPS